jgi:hypothetical protein
MVAVYDTSVGWKAKTAAVATAAGKFAKKRRAIKKIRMTEAAYKTGDEKKQSASIPGISRFRAFEIAAKR